MMKMIATKAPSGLLSGRPTTRPSARGSFQAGRALRVVVDNRSAVKTSAFFNFGKKKDNSYNGGGSSREEYETEDVEFYFNYMGMLATEGTYNRMYDLMKGRHPCDVILLMASKEGDEPKLEELIESGADLTVTDNDGKGVLDLCTKPEARAILEKAMAKA